MTSSRTRPSATSAPSARAAVAPTSGSSAAGRIWIERAAAIEVERGDAVDEHHVRARRPLERPPVGLAAARPGDRGAVRVGRIGGGQEVDRAAPPRRSAGVAHRPQPLDRAGQRELGGAEPVDEVAAPDPAGLLERPQDRVDRREPAVDPLARDRLAGHDAVPVEQGEGRARGAAPSAVAGRRRRRRATSGRPPRAARATSAGRAARPASLPPVRFQRSARSGANVSFVTSPAQTRSHSASRTSRSEPPPAAANSSR